MKIQETTYQPIFKTNMSEVELYGIEKMIDVLCEDEELFFNHEDLGLAYTSSSRFAMYNVCNGDFTHEDNVISYFAISDNGVLYMVTYNEEDEQVNYIIG